MNDIKFNKDIACSRWNDIIKRVLEQPPHIDLKVPKDVLPHPSLCGFLKRRGFPHGQRSDWERVLPSGGSIHVKEYDNRYEVHWDIVSPRVSVLGHLRKDSRHCWVLLSGGTAAAIGSFFGGVHLIIGSFFGGMLLGFLTSIRRL